MISIRIQNNNEKQTSIQHPYNRTIRVSRLEIIDNINDTHQLMTNICTPDTPVTAEENSRSRQKERNVIRYDESGTESL